MPIELECKIRVDSHAALRAKLTALGATRDYRVLETNVLFDRADGSLQKAGCGLRIRSMVGAEGQKQESTLTYKGPRRPGPFKCREEIEVAIADAEAMADLLRALGYAERAVFQKRRESWRLGGCRVELDELPRLGFFVEIEGPNENAIGAALADLSLDTAEKIEATYVSMVASLAPPKSGKPVELRFGDSP